MIPTETELRLLHSYMVHNPETGFQELRPDTPENVKVLYERITREAKHETNMPRV